MNWQDHFEVAKELALVRDLPMFALFVTLDAITGLSRYLAMVLGMEKRRDLLLLVILIACAIWVDWRGDFFPVYNGWERPTDPALQDAFERQRKLWLFYYWFLPELEVISAAICAVLARSQGRSFFVWMPLGYLGNVGAIVWLLWNRKKDKARQAGIVEQPA